MDRFIQGESMTSSELRANLLQAQALLADVYSWAQQPHTKYTGMRMNSEIAREMSTADSCINDALEELE
jgi:hypothetical protein